MDMAEALNLGCLCSTLERERLHDDLQAHGWWLDRPHLFSSTPVFMAAGDFTTIERAVSALHRVSALPGYQAQALQRTPGGSALPGPDGVFMGYDFHLTEDGPRLIEINTNAGGAFLHAAAVRAHRACCKSVQRRYNAPTPPQQLEAGFLAMFRSEWQARRGDQPLRTVAIVDDEPAAQYLAPEFDLARAFFEADGIAAVVADPRELQWRDGALWHPELPHKGHIDLVYNRLTDFDLSQPAHAALRDAYLAGGAVVTPNPRAHALHADKRNLVTLANDGLLAAWDAADDDRAVLRAVVPATQPVTPDNADVLWAQRRQLFFKPATGYGSKAAFRGDKLTRRVWGEILQGGFVAQALVPPSERMVDVAGTPTRLKLDLRAYAYRGQIQLLAARTYAGQTTNFRTQGGGFSPVVVLPAAYPSDAPSGGACAATALSD